MAPALIIVALALYGGLGLAGVIYWTAAKARSRLHAFAAWSAYVGGWWAIFFGLFAPGGDRWIALAAPLAGPVLVAGGYLSHALRYDWRPRTSSPRLYRPRSPAHVADGD